MAFTHPPKSNPHPEPPKTQRESITVAYHYSDGKCEVFPMDNMSIIAIMCVIRDVLRADSYTALARIHVTWNGITQTITIDRDNQARI